MKRYGILIIFCLLGNLLYGQTEYKSLDSLAREIPALNTEVDVTVSGAPVQEFLRGLASQAGINMNIDPSLTFTVSNNFNKVKVKDVLRFLVEGYDLEIKTAGSILNVRKRNVDVNPRSKIKIDWNGKDLVSISVSQVPLKIVANEITEKTGQNIVVMPGSLETQVSCLIKNMALLPALEKIALGNNFSVRKTEDGVVIFEPVAPVNVQAAKNDVSQKGRIANGTPDIKLSGKDSIKISAQNCRLDDVVNKLFPMLNKPYNIISSLDDIVSLKYESISFESLIKEMFAGTLSTFKFTDGKYRIGKRNIIDLEEVRMVQLKYRTIDSIIYVIPNQLKKEVDIKTYPDMNSLVLSGSYDRVNLLEQFLQEIDKKIPVILIDVLIIDNKNSKELTTGVTAGLSDKPSVSKGQVYPSVDMTLSSSSINEIINGLNGFGWVNLGKVKPNFYMTLKALETDGIIEMKSTPQLSTLNGHKAKMSIGNTEYYQEQLNNIFGSMTTNSQMITTYKPVDAELSVTIRPIVDGDENVTLEIKVEQSDFTDRISQFAPPGKVSRKFESLIRVKDQEMVLLGGLEQKQARETRKGLPLISRIPLLNWIFTSREKSNSKSKLNIFIKPTIIY